MFLASRGIAPGKPTKAPQLVYGGLLSKTICAENTMGALCNQASPVSHKRRSCGYVSTSTQPRRLSGRSHDFYDYAQATSLAVDEHPRRTALMLR